jgi:hypothetical protein
MQLLTIADLQRPQAELDPLIKEVQNLGNMYYEFIKHDQATYSYEVVDYAGSTRAIGFHASELSGCLRRLVYSISGSEQQQNQEQDVNMKLRFRVGTAVHSMLQSDFKRMASSTNGRLYFEEELKISPNLQAVAAEWDIHSSMDGLFTICQWHPEHQQWFAKIRVGLEIKTQSDKDFDSTKKPKDEHKDQTCVYMKCLDLPLMWTLYYNKSNSNITTPYAPWLSQFDSKRWDTLSRRMVSATDYKNRQVLPDREEGKPCGWCPYAWHCEPEFLKRKKRYGSTVVSPGLLTRR